MAPERKSEASTTRASPPSELRKVVSGDGESDKGHHGQSQSNLRKGASVKVKETASPGFVSGLNDHWFVTIPLGGGGAPGEGLATGLAWKVLLEVPEPT